MIRDVTPPINSVFHLLRVSGATCLLLLVGTAGCASTFAVEGSGHRIAEQRPVDEPFDTVELRGSSTVVIRVDPEAEASISVTTDDNLQEHVETQTTGDMLLVQTHGLIDPTRGVRVDVVAPQIGMVLLSGSGNLIVSRIDTKSLRAELRGSGDIRLSGRADEVMLELSGSGDIDARDLTAEVGHARLSGSGEITLHATTAADLEVSGSGDILCLGNPQQRSAHVSGSGDIHIR